MPSGSTVSTVSLGAPSKVDKFNDVIKSPMLTYAWEIYFLGAISLSYAVPGMNGMNYRVRSVTIPDWGFSEMRIPVRVWSVSFPGHHIYGEALDVEFVEDADLMTYTFLSAWTRLIGQRELGDIGQVYVLGFPLFSLWKSMILITMHSSDTSGTAVGKRNSLFMGVYPLTISNPRLDTRSVEAVTYKVKFAYDYYYDISDLTSVIPR